MNSAVQSGPGLKESETVGRGQLRTGRVLSGLVAVLMLLDAAMKFFPPSSVAADYAHMGWPLHLSPVLGWLVLASAVVYVIPRTAVLGAILLTGYLGGAVATNLRLELPLFSQILSPVYVGVLVWGALWLRDPAVRSMIPLRRSR